MADNEETATPNKPETSLMVWTNYGIDIELPSPGFTDGDRVLVTTDRGDRHEQVLDLHIDQAEALMGRLGQTLALRKHRLATFDRGAEMDAADCEVAQ